nr:transposase (putative), gypsy type [Tanacetum cinerariifolium]
MVRDGVQLETAVNTISHEYLLEFTSEYGIPEMFHPELPGPGVRIVDFPEGKVGVYTRYFEFANFRLPLSQFLFDVLGWMSFSKRPGKNTPQCYTKPLDSFKNWNNRFFWVDECVFPTVVDWRTNASKDGMPKSEMDLFSLIRAQNPTKVKTWSRPRAPHEVLFLTLIAARVIEMDEPAMETDSSGGTTALEVPPPEDVPATAVPEVGQSKGAVAAEPPVARESRKRGHDGIDATAPPNDPDPLSFADAPLHHPVNVAQSSQGVAAAGDPESENISSPAEVGSPGSVYRPEWGVTNGSLLDTPEACQDLVAIGSQLRLRFEQEAKLLRKSVAQVARRDQRIQAQESKIKNLEALLETEVSGEETLKAAFEEYKRENDQLVEQRCAEMDARLDALSIDFDEELYPHMLTAIAGRRWVIGHGLRLAMMKCAESLEMRQAFADVVSARVAKGMSEGLKHRVEHGHAQLMVESLEAYDPEAEAKFAVALQSLKDLKYPLLDQLEGLKDAPMDVIMAALYLESDTGGMPYNLYATSVPAPLSLPSPCTWRSDGIPVSVPTLVPQGLSLLLVDAATQTDLEDV